MVEIDTGARVVLTEIEASSAPEAESERRPSGVGALAMRDVGGRPRRSAAHAKRERPAGSARVLG